MSLTIAIIADIHFGADLGTKKGSAAKEQFQKFIRWQKALNPDLVVDLGDRISDIGKEGDIELMSEVAQWFKEIEAPVAHLMGNHDSHFLSATENSEILGSSCEKRSIDLEGYHLIFFNTRCYLDQDKGLSFDKADLEWLREDLESTNLPTVLFSHVPLDNGSMTGNFYFERMYAHHAHYPDGDMQDLREIIERSNKVTLCINGHTHWNTYQCINGIHYVTVPSLTELFPTYPESTNAMTLLNIDEDIHIKVEGNLPIEYRLPIRQRGSKHWINIDKDYAPEIVTPK